MMDHNDKGFTLIEVLIVILIISIVSGVAVFTLSHNKKKQLEYLANNLSRIITLAEEEAMLRPATLGLAFTPTHFQFFEYVDIPRKNHWQALTDPILGLHHFSNDVEITVMVQRKKVSLNGQPQIIISTSGDITPFVIWIGKKDQRPAYEVVGHSSGNVISGIFHEHS